MSAARATAGDRRPRDGFVGTATHPGSVPPPNTAAAAAVCDAKGPTSQAVCRLDGSCTSEVRDAIVAASRYATTADAVEWWGEAVCNVQFTEGAQEVFCAAEVRDAFERTSHFATTASAVLQWARALRSVVCGSARKLLATVELRDALIRTARYASTNRSIRWWAGAVCCLEWEASMWQVDDEAALRDVLVAIARNANSARATMWWKHAFCTIHAPPRCTLTS